MRVIAGELRGRKLLPPVDAQTTRPVTDRVKQSLFDKLESHALLEEGHVVDLFSGTGSMGIEALSRGSDFCTFVDNDKVAVERLRRNLTELGLESYASVQPVSVGALTWAAGLRARGPVQVAFVDPPYALMRDEDAGEQVSRVMAALLPAMHPTGVVVLRTPIDVDPVPQRGWRGPRHERYGGMRLSYYAPDVPEGDEGAAAGGA